MPGRIGVRGYVTLMKALPGTAAKLSADSGFKVRSVAAMMRRFWLMGLVHPGSTVTTGRHSHVVWMSGEGENGTKAKCGPKLRPGLQHIAFAYACRALHDGATTQDVADAMGSSLETGQRFVRLFRDQQMAHIAEWRRGTDGKPVAVFEYGPGPDAKKPKQSAAEKSRRCRAAARVRVLMFHGASVFRQAA